MNTRLLRGIRNVSATALILIAWTTVVTTRAAEGDTVASQLREKGFEQSWIDSLTQKGTPRVYSGDELRFIGQPVGGLFAGQLYMGGDGRLWYWDLFNKRVMDPGGPGDKYYNAPMHPDDFRTVSSGFALEVDDRAVPLDGRGFDSVEFRGQYPIAKATFSDKDLPVKVRLEAFSPFCPTSSQLSSMPATMLCYSIANTSDKAISLRVGGWLENAVSRAAIKAGAAEPSATPIEGVTGLLLAAKPQQRGAADDGSMAIALLGDSGQTLDARALSAKWIDALRSKDDGIPANSGVVQSKPRPLDPGESIEFRFAICWHFANGHRGDIFPGSLLRRNEQRRHYAKFFDDAGQIAQELQRRHDELTALTRLWRDCWYDSTLPVWFLDRTFLSVNALATSSCLRLHDTGDSALDGRVYFWEGNYLGPGTCTHVTHYEQAFGRLFPDAARAQRTITDFGVGWNDELGYVQYRAEWNIGHHFGIPHAIDGHAGTILRTYREHTTNVDDSFLRPIWPRVKRAVEFMIDQDTGRGFFADKVPAASVHSEPDGILEGPQYHTLDKYWNGVIPWHSGLYMASLRAAAAMAEEMGDAKFAAECARIADTGRQKLASSNFNEEFGYFIHTPEATGEPLVNTNRGCHIDQVMGDYWTSQIGLRSVFPRAVARSALAKLFHHNLHARLQDYRSTAVIPCVRFYADNDEPGFVMCTFPHGGARDAVPPNTEGWDALVVGYFSECMTGFTYQAAAHMISKGLVTEGLALCRAIHDRYAEAPLRRNPFNEIEYGNHYTRAMSGYGAFIAITGFQYHGPRGHIGFAPRLGANDFRSAFTTARGWGTFQQRAEEETLRCKLTLRHGRLMLNSFSVVPPSAQPLPRVTSVLVNGVATNAFAYEEDRLKITFDRKFELIKGDSVDIEIVY